MTILQLLLISCFAVHTTLTANILVMLPWPWYSHTNNYMPIFKGLAAKGHNVTMVSPFPQKKPIPNFNDIVFPNLIEEMMDRIPERNLVKLEGIWFKLVGLWYLGIEWLKITYKQDIMKKLIEDQSSKYDLIIIESWFMQESFVAFGHKYNAPVVNLASRYIFPLAAHLTGNQLPTSYVQAQKLPYSDRMSFLQRALNMFHYYWEVIAGEFYHLRKQEALMREHFKYPGSENLPPLVDMLRNTSLTLMDSSFAIGYPTPLHQNVIEFGGINIKKPEKLPPDLQKFMDNAKDGVVYFSLGSFTDVSLLDSNVQQAIISAFGKLKWKVVMKLEATNPYINMTKSNILVKEWLPQVSILAHPNCKLFITHAGLHGVMEGIYYKVPIVAIPLFSDQHINAKFLASVGVGIVVNLEEVTEEKLLNAINTVLTSPSYQENANIRSEIFKDTPINTLDNAVYWIEYVIRHKGAPHLRPAVLDLHWYQYLMLDVIAFYLLLILLIVYIIKFILTLLFRCIKSVVFKVDSKDKVMKSKAKSKNE